MYKKYWVKAHKRKVIGINPFGYLGSQKDFLDTVSKMSAIIHFVLFIFLTVVIPLTIVNCFLNWLITVWIQIEDEREDD